MASFFHYYQNELKKVENTFPPTTYHILLKADNQKVFKFKEGGDLEEKKRYKFHLKTDLHTKFDPNQKMANCSNPGGEGGGIKKKNNSNVTNGILYINSKIGQYESVQIRVARFEKGKIQEGGIFKKKKNQISQIPSENISKYKVSSKSDNGNVFKFRGKGLGIQREGGISNLKIQTSLIASENESM